MVSLLPEWSVWRLYRVSVDSDTFRGDFMVKSRGKICLEIALGFHGENMANQITRQFPY